MLRTMLEKHGLSRYVLTDQWYLDSGYLACLSAGIKKNPSQLQVHRIAAALFSRGASPEEVDDLFVAAGYRPVFCPYYRLRRPEKSGLSRDSFKKSASIGRLPPAPGQPPFRPQDPA